MNEMKIVNMVATAIIGENFDLEKIALALPESKYEPKRFPGLVLRLPEPKTATLLFRNGKIVSTGAKNIDQIRIAVNKVCEKLKKIGFEIIKNPEIMVQNIVASADLNKRLDLDAVALAVGMEKVEYEPEQFPGLVYRLDEPPAVFLLFNSGKLICVGAKTAEHASEAIDRVSKELRSLGLL